MRVDLVEGEEGRKQTISTGNKELGMTKGLPRKIKRGLSQNDKPPSEKKSNQRITL